ncbi:MAG: hypothetical protein GXY82_04990 [Methanospirillum sp.]|nr:hypothetical protein [Methanospirillum sp.]
MGKGRSSQPKYFFAGARGRAAADPAGFILCTADSLSSRYGRWWHDERPVQIRGGCVLSLLLAVGAAAADANTTLEANATPPAAWEHTYGGLSNETLISLLGETGDGYLLVGESAGDGAGGDVYLVRADSNGTPAREARVPFGAGSPVAAARTPENGTVVIGETGGAGPGSADVVLVRLDPDGRQLWSRSYSVGSGRDTAAAVRQATDGGYLVAGTTDSPGGGSPGLLLLKVGGDGGETWHRSLPLGGSVLVVGDLVATPDGGYLVVGSTGGDRGALLDMLLVKVSSGGYREWQRTYSFGAETASGRTLAPASDGGWLLLGGVGGANSEEAVLVKVNTAGNEQWRKRLSAGGARTWGYALAPAGGGGYAVVGAAESREGTTRSWVAVLDRTGTEAWNRSFAIGNGPSRALAVTAPDDTRLVVGGEASRTTDALNDLYLSSVVRPTVAPNATPTAIVDVTSNLTATPSSTPTANATGTAVQATTVPATTRAGVTLPLCLVAIAGVALVAALRRH